MHPLHLSLIPVFSGSLAILVRVGPGPAAACLLTALGLLSALAAVGADSGPLTTGGWAYFLACPTFIGSLAALLCPPGLLDGSPEGSREP